MSKIAAVKPNENLPGKIDTKISPGIHPAHSATYVRTKK